MQQPVTTESVAPRFSTLERPLWALCLIAALALCLRRLDEIPVGLNADEALQERDAQTAAMMPTEERSLAVRGIDLIVDPIR